MGMHPNVFPNAPYQVLITSVLGRVHVVNPQTVIFRA